MRKILKVLIMINDLYINRYLKELIKYNVQFVIIQ